MAEHYNIILLGGGPTSAQAAKAIRAVDQSSSIFIIGGEPYLPYDRPPLSKSMMHNLSLNADDISSVDNNFYKENHVRAWTGVKAESIDRAAKTVRASDGQDYGYDKLLIATGSTPKKLDATGTGTNKVKYLRTYDESLAIREALDHAKSAVMVGAGYIGMEIAAACIKKGVQATIIEPKDQPWSKFASKAMGDVIRDWYEKHGVKFIFDDEVTQVDEQGEQLAVTTKNGQTVVADVVVSGVGVKYNTEIAKEAELDVDDKGRIKVDKTLRTSDESIWAAGDFAAYFDDILGKEFNAEHHLNARWQGQTVGRNLTGAHEAYAKVPYFFSDMNELHMILRGKADDVSHTKIVKWDDGKMLAEFYPGEDGGLKMAIALSFEGDDKKLDPLADKFEEWIKAGRKVEEIAEEELVT